jgi:peroxiredoxin
MRLRFPCFTQSIFLILLALSLSQCTRHKQEVNTSVRVKIKHSHGGMVFLEKITLDGTLVVDSGKVNKQGEVQFSFYTADFEFMLLRDQKSGQKIMLLVAGEETPEVFTSGMHFGEDYSVTGSGGSVLLMELEQKRSDALSRLDSLGQSWLRERYAADNLQQKQLFDSIGDLIIERHRNHITSFIERYPESPAQIIAIYQTLKPGVPLFTLEDDYLMFKAVSDSLMKRFPQNEHVKDFSKRTLAYKEEFDAFQQREKLLQPGQPAPAVALFSTAGEKVSLEEHAGKFVLLYFWDARKQESWEYNRQLAALYQTYRYRGFEILGIYTGKDKQLYYNAIKIDALPWVHLFSNSAVEKSCNIKETPMMMLIDREGRIMARSMTIETLSGKLPLILPEGGHIPSEAKSDGR